MRSEREAGPGLARGGGREKRPMETPLRRESPRRDPETPPPPPGPPPPHPALGRQREEKRAALSKVVIRRLPPSLTKEQLEEQLHPLPAHDYFEFCTADPRSLMKLLNSIQPRTDPCGTPLETYPLNDDSPFTVAY